MYPFNKLLIYSIVITCLYFSRITSERFPRLIRGKISDIETLPYVVSLRYNMSYYCSGSILSNQYILTAASCNRPDVNNIKVRVGSKFFRKLGRTIKAKEFIEHPEFNNQTLNKDIAIIVLKFKIHKFKDRVQPVTLADFKAKLPDPGELVTVSGWGATESHDNYSTPSEELRSVNLPIMSREVCQMCHPEVEITEFMFCAGYFLGGNGPSTGDTGGPVMYNGIQYGVTSLLGGIEAYPMSPGVFISVPKVRSFIKGTTKI